MARIPRRLTALLRALLRRQTAERELDEELQFHLDKLVESHLAAGMSPAQARAAARKAFGGLEQSKEECRDARATLLDGLLRDGRFALRMFRRNPGFALVVVLSLALGVGANAAIFSLVDQALLQRLPGDSERLVLLSWNGAFFGKW